MAVVPTVVAYHRYVLALRQAAIAGTDSGHQRRRHEAANTPIPEQKQHREANAGLGLECTRCLVAIAEADPDCQTGSLTHV